MLSQNDWVGGDKCGLFCLLPSRAGRGNDRPNPFLKPVRSQPKTFFKKTFAKNRVLNRVIMKTG